MTVYHPTADDLAAEARNLEQRAAMARLAEATAALEQIEKDMVAMDLADIQRRVEQKRANEATVAALGQELERARRQEAHRVSVWRRSFEVRAPLMDGWSAHVERTSLEAAEQGVAASDALATAEQQRQERAILHRALGYGT